MGGGRGGEATSAREAGLRIGQRVPLPLRPHLPGGFQAPLCHQAGDVLLFPGNDLARPSIQASV